MLCVASSYGCQSAIWLDVWRPRPNSATVARKWRSTAGKRLQICSRRHGISGARIECAKYRQHCDPSPQRPGEIRRDVARRGDTLFVALVVLALVGLMIATESFSYWLIAAIIKLLETSVLPFF